MNTTANSQQATATGGVHVMAMANAATLVGEAAYLICAVVAALAPGLYLAFFQSWFHGISLASLQAGAPPFSIATFIIGLVTFGVSVWLVGAAIASLYNRMAR